MQELQATSEKIKSLIRTQNYSTKEIADLAGCTSRNVRYAKSRMETRHTEARLLEYLKSVRADVERLTERVNSLEAIRKAEIGGSPR